MPYHEWGDDWQYWDDLYKAQRFIIDYVYKYSLCRLVSKEKYGTIRYEHIIPIGSSLCFGNTKINKILLKLFGWKTVTSQFNGDVYKTQRIIYEHTIIYRLWLKLGKIILKKAVFKAVKKYPQIKHEILFDYGEEYI